MAKVILPDVRFGSSFLDKRYKKFAELGEVIMDKITGELLVKRKADGRIISFTQNDKYIHDIMVELRILMKQFTSFTYPTDASSWFTSSDYGVVELSSKTVENLLKVDSIDFPNTSLSEDQVFRFKLSKECNGFFLRPITRDTDKNVCEYLTQFFNNAFRSYAGDNPDFIAEREKLKDSSYESCNAVVSFVTKVTGTINSGTETREFSSTANIRVNESNFIQIPSTYKTIFSSVDSIVIEIDSISFPKFSKSKLYMEQNLIEDAVYKKLVAPDENINVEWVNILSFIDSSDDIVAHLNVENIALMDSQFLREYIGKIDKLSGSAGVIPSVTRPTPDIWTVNNAWAEIIRYVRAAGVVEETQHETDINEMEKYIYNTSGIPTNFTFDKNRMKDIYIEEK